MLRSICAFFAVFSFASSVVVAQDKVSPGVESILGRARAIRDMVYCADTKRDTQVGPASSEDLEKVRQLAQGGMGNCQILLGSWYENGYGVDVDYVKARELYESASVTQAKASYALGRMAQNGHGQKISYANAINFYQAAAGANVVEAQLALADIYENGQGVDKNLRLASDYYRKAAARGIEKAWEKLEWIQETTALFSDEQIKADREVWVHLFTQKLQNAVQGSEPVRSLSSLRRVGFSFSFERGKKYPQVELRSSSGDAAFDQFIVSSASKINMPAPPFYSPDVSVFQKDLVLTYLPLAESKI